MHFLNSEFVKPNPFTTASELNELELGKLVYTTNKQISNFNLLQFDQFPHASNLYPKEKVTTPIPSEQVMKLQFRLYTVNSRRVAPGFPHQPFILAAFCYSNLHLKLFTPGKQSTRI